MLKQFVKFLLLATVGLLALAACTVAGEPATNSAAGNVETASNEASSDADSQLAAIPPLDSVSDDFTLVGTTGRPQFLNAYASW